MRFFSEAYDFSLQRNLWTSLPGQTGQYLQRSDNDVYDDLGVCVGVGIGIGAGVGLSVCMNVDDAWC